VPRHVIGSVDAFPSGTRVRVELGGRAIVVFNVDGTFYGLRDVCPHQGALLSAGRLVGAVSASGPGCYEYDAGRKMIKCPWHGWEFDLATGQSWFDPQDQHVQHYSVKVLSGRELVDDQLGTGAPDSAKIRGPFVASTVKVGVQNDYVVVET
jgi:nitrite reductase/ring-hydroxylating ferredoxin subunit